ncbi:N-acetylated-alpha-linked acidic dipeptidase 2-like isoform X1 [Amphibalanus amphitrite]|uniref:N-acetylated-alpha-linked acidic dipeptidase 2-like isoform X1 n=1 Tax=Amphibalanus amphitrite TaxID=1232801 RepID=UPI001C921898|nr:N-acetylated-alpha-linked acidic dipeptidase 2-like isoform X1 [Amphibalanus amphitrite]
MKDVIENKEEYKRLMVYPEEEEGDGLRLPLSPVGQRGYGLDRNRRSSAEDFGSTSEEDEMVLHPLESVLKQIRERPVQPRRWAYCCSGVVFAGMIGLVVGFTMAYGLFLSLEAPCAHSRVWLTGSDHVHQRLLSDLRPENVANFLRELTRRPHVAGLPENERLAQYVADTWRAQGLDRVEELRYDVLLSYPDGQNPNLVRVVDETGQAVFTAQTHQPPLHSPEERDPSVLQNFNAYSAPGQAQGKVIYVNYGREEDFLYLQSQNISLKDHIVIARYGKIFRGNKAYLCEQFGCSALLLYSDPADGAPLGQSADAAYPNTVYMPSAGAQLGTVYRGTGDPLTPIYPSLESAYRLSEAEAELPRIPVQPISADDAYQILKLMPPTAAAPADWWGGLNLTYGLGPGPARPGWTVLMDIHTHGERANATNVIATLRGYEEPDRYVLVGNHRDAWILGAIDPSSGTAAMLELTRVLANLRKETGWRPRRSLVFCSWGAEEYGLVGSTEWVQHHRQQLAARAVAYLNVDLTINGNDTLRALGVPLLHDLLFAAARTVPNPDPEEVAAGRTTVYDTWLLHRLDNATGRPQVTLPGRGSDYKQFLHVEGVPSSDHRYFQKTDSGSSYPLYHTLYETYYMVTELQDRGLHFTTAVAQMWGEMARRLADDPVLPFGVVRYGTFLQEAFSVLEAHFGPRLRQNGVTLDYVRAAVEEFAEAATTFQEHFLRQLDLDDPLAVRQANDILMGVERSFLDPRGLPDRPDYNHVIFSPSSSDGYSGVVFPGLVDLLHDLDRLPADRRAAQWQKIKLHVSVLSYIIGSAAHGLQQDI